MDIDLGACSAAEIKKRQCRDCRKYACNDLKCSSFQSAYPSYHEDVFEFADGNAFNARLDSGSVDHLAVSDVKSDVIRLAVVVMVKINNVAYLHTVKGNLCTVLGLHIGSMRELDIVVILIAVHRESGSVKT